MEGVILSRSKGGVRSLAEQLQKFQKYVAVCNILATYSSTKPVLEPTAPHLHQIVRRESPFPSAVLTLPPPPRTAAICAKKDPVGEW